jgi:hypothetical protein
VRGLDGLALAEPEPDNPSGAGELLLPPGTQDSAQRLQTLYFHDGTGISSRTLCHLPH